MSITRLFFLGLAILLLGVGGYWAYGYMAWNGARLSPGEVVFRSERQSGELEEYEVTTEIPYYELEEVVSGLFVPWSIVFTSDERMLVSERNGRVREVVEGNLRTEPLIVFDEVSTTGEEGLMGMTLHPEYLENQWVYACVAYPSGGGLVNKVVRMLDEGSSMEIDRVIIDDMPSARFHAGCRIAFGPDGMLYITTGDASQRDLAQEMDSLAGKILRMDGEGGLPEDNPFEGSYIFSLGHRNPQGIDWHPVTGEMYSSEHGPSVFDGPAGGDEFNRIIPGENYGWPLVSHDDNLPGLIGPIIQFTPAEAPGSGVFYDGDVFEEFRYNFFFGALRGEGIVRLILDPDDPDELIAHQKLPGIDVGRVRDVVVGPDGYIYFTTSNVDGRGEVREGDDRVYRIVPIQRISD